MTLSPAYSDDLVTVYHCDHATLAAHLRETGVMCDALVTDCPYSERTHVGHDDGAATANRAKDFAERNAGASGHRKWQASYSGGEKGERRTLDYRPWTEADVGAFVADWSPVVRGWWVSLTDHVLAPAWERYYGEAFLYSFAPLACVEPGSRVRMTGDGPCNWSCWALVARPRTREFSSWGALPGAYVTPPGMAEVSRRVRWVGGKPVWLIRALVRDYSRAGALIVDPCCGAGTLGVAVRYEGRRAILADRDEAAVLTTIKRLRGERTKPVNSDLPADAPHALSLFREVG